MSPERMQYAAKLRAMHEDVSSRTRRSILAASAVGGTFLFLLLAAASYAQTVRTADAQPFVTSPLPGKQNAATQDDSIRTFHINVPDEQLVNYEVWRRHAGLTRKRSMTNPRASAWRRCRRCWTTGATATTGATE